MVDQEYISIKEFAERAGVSPQAIYKRLNQVGNQLINYIKPVGNQRMLNIRASVSYTHLTLPTILLV